MKIGLKRIDIQKGITVEVLLDSRIMELVMIYCILHFSYVISVSALYSSSSYLIFSLFFLYSFFKNILLITYCY